MYSQLPDNTITRELDSLPEYKTPISTRQDTLSNQHLKSIHRRFSIATIMIPTLGTVVAVSLIPYWGFGTMELSLLICGYFLTLSGVETGFHRLFSHKSFQCNKGVWLWFGILGSMAAEGPVINWAATHRRHHRYSDRLGDPHSPVYNKTTKLKTLPGFLHAHMGWMFNPEVTNSILYARDFLRDPLVFWINRWYLGWVSLGLLIPTVLGFAITGSWVGAVKGLLWGGLVRIFCVHHATWSTNSLGHIIGRRPYGTKDRSTNNFWLSILSVGGSWHNNHHAFAYSACHGLEWWQLDPGAWTLRTLEKLGWVWAMRVPTEQVKQAKRRDLSAND